MTEVMPCYKRRARVVVLQAFGFGAVAVLVFVGWNGGAGLERDFRRVDFFSKIWGGGYVRAEARTLRVGSTCVRVETLTYRAVLPASCGC